MPETPTPRHRSAIQRPAFVGAAALVVIIGVVAVYSVLRYQEYERVHAATQALATQLVADAEAAFEAIPPLTSEEAGALRTYRNPEHLVAAERFGVDPPVDREAAEALLDTNALVALEDNRYFHVRDMDHSVPYVTESTQNLLTLIGMEFQKALREAGLPPYRFVITSGTRTLDDQRRLQGVNVNAAAKSSHWFGTTVDLHYAAFDYRADDDSLQANEDVDPQLLRELVMNRYAALAESEDGALKAILGRTLRALQREGDVLVIYERRQPVYHITVADAVPDPRDEMVTEIRPSKATISAADSLVRRTSR